jgi:ferredoxin-NADP reductase
MAKALSFKAEVSQVVLETMDVLTFRFDIPKDVPFTFKAGQFVNLTVDTPEYGPGNEQLMRPYSISSSPTEEGYFDLTIKCYDDGHVTKHLREVTYVGEVMTVEGPFSNFHFEEGMAESIALIGGGAGVAPMRGIIRYILDKSLPVRMRYLASCRTPNDMIYLATLIGWREHHRNLEVTHTITRPQGFDWQGPTGRIDVEKLMVYTPPEETELFYVAGPTDMVRDVRKVLQDELAVDKKRIYWEPWG